MALVGCGGAGCGVGVVAGMVVVVLVGGGSWWWWWWLVVMVWTGGVDMWRVWRRRGCAAFD